MRQNQKSCRAMCASELKQLDVKRCKILTESTRKIRGVALGLEIEKEKADTCGHSRPLDKSGHLRPLAATRQKRPLAATRGHSTKRRLADNREKQPLAATGWVLSINFKPCTCCGKSGHSRPQAGAGHHTCWKRMLMKKKVKQKAGAHYEGEVGEKKDLHRAERLKKKRMMMKKTNSY